MTGNEPTIMPSNLAGQLLVATPQMTDPRFKHKAIFMCQHDDKAAMGLVINNPSSDIALSQLNEKLGIEMQHFDSDDTVYIGGHVEPQRGYILHSNDHMMPDTIPVTKDICLSIHVDMIKEISRGFGPVMKKSCLAMLAGHQASWKKKCGRICGFIWRLNPTCFLQQTAILSGIAALLFLHYRRLALINKRNGLMMARF